MKADENFMRRHEAYKIAIKNLESIANSPNAEPIDVNKIRDNLSTLKESVEGMVLNDGLTGLLNYNGLKIKYDEIVETCRREMHNGATYPISSIAIDLDGFKAYNDEFGHEKGNDLLRDFAGILGQNTRKTDAARYGGDEFFILLPKTPLEGAKIVAERIRKNFEDYCTRNGVENLSISAGVSSYPETTENSDDLIDHSDDALYDSKNNGKNMVSVYAKK